MFRHYNNLNCLITRLILKISPSVVLAICKFSVSNLFLSSPSILSLRQKMAAACHYCRFKSIKNSLRSGSIAETVELQLKPKKKSTVNRYYRNFFLYHMIIILCTTLLSRYNQRHRQQALKSSIRCSPPDFVRFAHPSNSFIGMLGV